MAADRIDVAPRALNRVGKGEPVTAGRGVKSLDSAQRQRHSKRLSAPAQDTIAHSDFNAVTGGLCPRSKVS
jgi:hypothetical protein